MVHGSSTKLNSSKSRLCDAQSVLLNFHCSNSTAPDAVAAFIGRLWASMQSSSISMNGADMRKITCCWKHNARKPMMTLCHVIDVFFCVKDSIVSDGPVTVCRKFRWLDASSLYSARVTVHLKWSTALLQDCLTAEELHLWDKEHAHNIRTPTYYDEQVS